MLSNQERLMAKRGRRKLYRARALFYLFCLFVFVFGMGYLVRSDWFALGRLVVEGGSVMTQAEVEKVTGARQPINFFTFDRSNMEDVLRHDLRVESVSTRYVWPNILKVTIVEKKPVAYVVCAYGGYAKVDFRGEVLAVGMGIKAADAPFVSGVKLGNVYVGDKIHEPEVIGVLSFVSKLDSLTNADIAEISVDKEGNAKVRLISGLPVLLGRAETAGEKAEMFSVISKELRAKRINAEYIDLSYSKPYIKLSSVK